MLMPSGLQLLILAEIRELFGGEAAPNTVETPGGKETIKLSKRSQAEVKLCC